MNIDSIHAYQELKNLLENTDRRHEDKLTELIITLNSAGHPGTTPEDHGQAIMDLIASAETDELRTIMKQTVALYAQIMEQAIAEAVAAQSNPDTVS